MRITTAFLLSMGAHIAVFLVLALLAAIDAWHYRISWSLAFGEATRDLINLGAAQMLGVLMMIALGWRFFAPRQTLPAALRLERIPPLWLIASLIYGVALQFSLSELENWLRELWPMDAARAKAMQALLNPQTSIEWLGILLTIPILAPISEEIFFRGWLFPRLSAAYRWRTATLTTAFLFALHHVEYVAMVYAFIAGILFALIFHWTRSLFTTLTMHIAFNATPLLLNKHTLPIKGFNLFHQQVQHMDWAIPMGATLVVAALTYWFYGMRPEQLCPTDASRAPHQES